MSANVPVNLKYASSHEWIRVEGDVGTVGITDHAQAELTDLVFVEPPQVGRVLKAGEPCAVVESVKTASDVYAPVSGEVIEANTAAANDPGTVNRDAFGTGWFFKIKLSDPSELGKLLGADQYRAQIGG